MRNATEEVVQRFDELIARGEEIREVCKRLYFAGNKRRIDPEEFQAWKTSCLSMLRSTFGSSSPHFDGFANLKFFDYYNSTQIYLGILKGARDDLRRGYFFHKDLMLSVNIYDSLLARARAQLEQGRLREAKGILLAVLTEVLGKICEHKRLPYHREDTVSDLAVALRQAQVIPESLQRDLADFQGRLESAENGQDLSGTTDAILRLLNDYLGSQIVILN